MSDNSFVLVPKTIIENKILLMRGKKVMLDRDLATLYGVKTQVLNQAVKRNSSRFPSDFMFQLTQTEAKDWISQIVISKNAQMGIRRLPFVFTEQGIAMLSGVLNSERAIAVNIQIMRTFTKLREMLSSNHLLRRKIEAMEKDYDSKFKVIFDVIKELVSQDEKSPQDKIGFKTDQ